MRPLRSCRFGGPSRTWSNGSGRANYFSLESLPEGIPVPGQQRSRNPHDRSTFAMIFSQLCRRARQAQGIASAFGTPVHRGCNDSVVADYRRIPSGSRGGGRAGARLGARLWQGGRSGAPGPPLGGVGRGRERWARLRVRPVPKTPFKPELARPGPEAGGPPPAGERQGGPPYFWFTEIKAPAAGSWHATLTPQQAGAGCGPITREIK